MKYFYSLIFLILIICGCEKNIQIQKDTPNDDLLKLDTIKVLKLDTFIVNNYLLDAKTIYFNEIKDDLTNPEHDKPILDTNKVVDILKMIQLVYDLKTPQTDSIFNQFKIHNYLNLKDYQIEINKDGNNCPELENLLNGTFPTGNQQLDYIAENFNVAKFQVLVYCYEATGYNYFISYPDTYNIQKILELYKSISEFHSVTLNIDKYGDGDKISIKRDTNFNTLKFILGTGDCPSGCTNQKIWEFKIQDDKATLLSSYGNIEMVDGKIVK